MNSLKTGAPASRRAILATSIAVAGTSMLAASAIEPAEATVIDPHPAWLERWREAWNEFCSIYCEIEGGDPVPGHALDLKSEAYELAYKIATTLPRTRAGAAAQLRLTWEDSSEMQSHGGEHDARLVESALAFLEGQNPA